MMGKIVELFAGRSEPKPAVTAPSMAAPTPQPTPRSTPAPIPEPTLASTHGSTALVPVPDPEVYNIVRDRRGIVVGLSRQETSVAHPGTDALDFLHRLIASGLGGQLITEMMLREAYMVICRAERLKPFPWLTVLREFNRLLKQIYGAAYRKTYGNVYEGGKLRKRRVYLIPRAEQAQEIISQVA